MAAATFRRLLLLLLLDDLDDDMGVYDERRAEPRAELDLALTGTFPRNVADDNDVSDDLGVPRASNALAAGVSDSARPCIDELADLTVLLPPTFLPDLLSISFFSPLIIILDCASRYAFVRAAILVSAILAAASTPPSAGRAKGFTR